MADTAANNHQRLPACKGVERESPVWEVCGALAWFAVIGMPTSEDCCVAFSFSEFAARLEADVKEYKIGLVAATIRLRLETGEAGEARIM